MSGLAAASCFHRLNWDGNVDAEGSIRVTMNGKPEELAGGHNILSSLLLLCHPKTSPLKAVSCAQKLRESARQLFVEKGQSSDQGFLRRPL